MVVRRARFANFTNVMCNGALHTLPYVYQYSMRHVTVALFRVSDMYQKLDFLNKRL